MGKNNKLGDEVWIDILNRIVLRPRLKAAARGAGIDPSSLFGKIKASIAEPENHQLVWLDTKASFADHLATARRLSIVELDRAALQLGIEGHSQPRFHDGRPVFKTDMQVAGDALTLDDFDWDLKYGSRSRDDVYARDKDGKLIQETVSTPPNAQLVSKLLSSLIPAYRDTATIEHHHSGGVVIEGQAPKALPAPAQRDTLGDTFGLAAPAEREQRPANTLAIPQVCDTSEDFDKKFRRKLVREVVLFRTTDGKLLEPLPDDIVVAGTFQARSFEDAGIKADVVRAETLLDAGFENDWLHELAPNWKPPKKPKVPPPTEEQREQVAQQAQAKIAKEPPSKASARADSENLGYGTPPPGGRRVRL